MEYDPNAKTMTFTANTVAIWGANNFANVAVTESTITFRGAANLYVLTLQQRDVVTGIEEIGAAPTTFRLAQNYPNPFNPATTIKFQMPATGRVSLGIYNALGQEVRRLVDEEVGAGEHQAVWDGTNVQGQAVSSGLYLYRLQAGSGVETRRMFLLR